MGEDRIVGEDRPVGFGGLVDGGQASVELAAADAAFDARMRAREAAYDMAVNGEVASIDRYTVSTDPADGSFAVLLPDGLDEIGHALIAGDVRRRFERAADGCDPFMGMRVPWPHAGPEVPQ